MRCIIYYLRSVSEVKLLSEMTCNLARRNWLCSWRRFCWRVHKARPSTQRSPSAECIVETVQVHMRRSWHSLQLGDMKHERFLRDNNSEFGKDEGNDARLQNESEFRVRMNDCWCQFHMPYAAACRWVERWLTDWLLKRELHYTLGCECVWFRNETLKWCKGTLYTAYCILYCTSFLSLYCLQV